MKITGKHFADLPPGNIKVFVDKAGDGAGNQVGNCNLPCNDVVRMADDKIECSYPEGGNGCTDFNVRVEVVQKVSTDATDRTKLCYEDAGVAEKAPSKLSVFPYMYMQSNTSSASPLINLTWSMSEVQNQDRTFIIDLSDNSDFDEGAKTWTHHHRPPSDARSIIIDLDQSLLQKTKNRWHDPLWKKVIFARIKLAEDGAESNVSPNWNTADKCTTSYLNNTADNPTSWICQECPDGASCDAVEPWSGVIALFGYYRIPSVTIPTTFERCLFPGSCLGGSNKNFHNTYYSIDSKSLDLAHLANDNVTESCNTQYGFTATSRLCHRCLRPGFSRVGLHRCKKCPKEAGVNYILIVVGVIFACIILAVLVKMTIDEVGKTKISESIQKCVLNYLQVAAMYTQIPLRW